MADPHLIVSDSKSLYKKMIVMSTVNGRDKTLRLAQYLFMFLRGKNTKDTAKSLIARMYYTCWLTRKVLLMGFPFYIAQKIINRIKAFMDEQRQTDEDSNVKDPNIDEDDVNIRQLYQEVKDTQPSSTEEYLKILEKSTIFGLAGQETRMVLTKIIKDICYLFILLLDIPIYLKAIRVIKMIMPETIEKLKKAQFFFWLIK